MKDTHSRPARSRRGLLVGILFCLTLPLSAAEIRFTILQINDVYEIGAVAGGTEGGIARLATLRKQLAEENPQTIMVIAGDFFSPSAIGTARLNGERLAGAQMVDCLNHAGLDHATFGNHEFDLNHGEFLKRMAESRFAWTCSNVYDNDGGMFPGVELWRILTFHNDAGDTVDVGLFGLCIDSNPKPYVMYGDALSTGREMVEILREKAPIIVALTHLNMEDDMQLATEVEGIDIIIGGHEHENMYFRRGPSRTVIAKADANARTAWVHRFTHDTLSGQTTIASELIFLDNTLPADPEVEAIVNTWTEKAFTAFRASGFEPTRVVTEVPIALNGLEYTVRNESTALTQIIADAYFNSAQDADISLYNGGSIRVDDILPAGPFTEYDAIRINPFGGHVVLVSMDGATLQATLDQGRSNQGSGGWLHTTGVSEQDSLWLIQGEPLDPDATYKVAMTDFLITGLERGMPYLNPDQGKVTLLATYEDVRTSLMNELLRLYAPQ